MVNRSTVTALLYSVFVLLSGCFSGSVNSDQAVQDKVFLHEKHMLPTGASANSHLAGNIYRYYPKKNIYYNIKTGLYFYLKEDRWNSSSAIPAVLSTDIGNFVTIEMDTDKPYQHHDEVQRKFPIR